MCVVIANKYYLNNLKTQVNIIEKTINQTGFDYNLI